MPIIQPTPIDQLPQPPNPADRANFNSLAYPFTAAMLPLVVQINKAISDMYNNALEAEAKAGEAGGSATAAANSATAANTAKAGAETAKAGAETARNGAQSSATAAAGSATAANTAKTGAEAARDAAAQSATDAAQSAADAAGAVQGNFGPAIHAATAKGTPADADELAVSDSGASWSLKKLTWGNLKSTIWAAFKAIATGSSAKNTLGLGTAATRDVGKGSGNVMEVGAFGIGVDNTIIEDPSIYKRGGFFSAHNTSNPATSYSCSINLPYYADGYSTQFFSAQGRSIPIIRVRNLTEGVWGGTYQLHHTGNILTTTGQSTEYPMTQKAVTDAIANIDISGPRPTKDHGAVATAGSQTVICNVQESDFHIMSMEAANTTGTLTIDFANMPDTVGKHFSWHVQIRRGGRKSVVFAQPVQWVGGVAPAFGTTTVSVDVIMFYRVGNGPIRAMIMDAY